MKKIIKGFIYAEPDTFSLDDNALRFGFSMYAPTTDLWPERVIVGEHSMEVEVPDNFDPRPAQIAALEEEKRKARIAFAAKLKELDDRIQSLLAIECSEVV